MLFCFGLILCFVTLSGCGDSGSGGDSLSGLTYSGVETAAVITTENAQQLGADALSVGSNSTPMGSIGLQHATDERQPAPPVLQTLVIALDDAALQMTPEIVPSYAINAASQRHSGTIYGDCADGPDGSAEYQIEADQGDGTFSGSLVFDNYCVDDAVIDGSANYSGRIDTQADEVLSFRLSFDMLTSQSDLRAFTFDGEIVIDMTTADLSTTINMLVRNDQTGRTFKVTDYQMSVTDYGSYTAVEIDGTFYDSQHGFVNLITTDPLLYETDAAYPHAGQMVLEGANGSSAQLTASETACHLQVDLDGDSVYELDEEYIWQEFF